jgi:hypothetical protein
LIVEAQDRSANFSWGSNVIDSLTDPSFNNPNTESSNYMDWRVPTFRELQFIYAEKDYLGGFDQVAYVCTYNRVGVVGDQPSMISFKDGKVPAFMTGAGRVRLVRSF